MASHKWLKNNNGSILLEFSFRKQRYAFHPVRHGNWGNKTDMAIANQVAGAIELEIKIGTFEGVDKYKQSSLVKTLDSSKPLDLQTIWEQYKDFKQSTTELTSQQFAWKVVDKQIKILLNINLADLTAFTAVQTLLKTYQPSTIRLGFTYLHAALQLAVKRKILKENPLVGYKAEIPQQPNKRKKFAFSLDEVKIIIEAFANNQFCPSNHYTSFVEFLLLTGIRPQMAIAVTWADINWQEGTISFNKAYTKGNKGAGKTKRIVIYPLYPQLLDLIQRLAPTKLDLVFTGPKGGHINLGNFTRNYWAPTIRGLVAAGKLHKYLPTYHCRHTAALMMSLSKVPSSTIAALLDSSEQMLSKHYLDSQKLSLSLDLQNLY